MLFRCNILALVGGGRNPRYPPHKVMIWDDHQNRCIGELSFRAEVRAVRLRRDRIVVALDRRVYTYNFADLSLVDHLETADNPRGLCAVCAQPSNNVLAVPGAQPGHVRVELYDLRKSTHIVAHETALACLALNTQGTRLATASEKGTLVRVYDTVSGELLQELRRGADKADIYCLAFNANSSMLACTSDKGTVHIFRLKESVAVPSVSESAFAGLGPSAAAGVAAGAAAGAAALGTAGGAVGSGAAAGGPFLSGAVEGERPPDPALAPNPADGFGSSAASSAASTAAGSAAGALAAAGQGVVGAATASGVGAGSESSTLRAPASSTSSSAQSELSGTGSVAADSASAASALALPVVQSFSAGRGGGGGSGGGGAGGGGGGSAASGAGAGGTGGGGGGSSAGSFMKNILPRYFSSEWSFAQFRVPEGKSICAFGTEPNTIIVVSADASFFKANYKDGGECIRTEFSSFGSPG